MNDARKDHLRQRTSLECDYRTKLTMKIARLAEGEFRSEGLDDVQAASALRTRLLQQLHAKIEAISGIDDIDL